MLSSGIARLYGNSMFNILKNFQNGFPKWLHLVHSHQQYMRVSLHPYQYLSLSFLIIAILMSVFELHFLLHVFVIFFCDKVCFSKVLYDDCITKKYLFSVVAVWVASWTRWYFHETFYLKEWLTSYGYWETPVFKWQIFSLKNELRIT